MDLTLLVTRNEYDELLIPDANIDRDGESIQRITWLLDPVTLPNGKFRASKPRSLTWIDQPPWYVIKDRPQFSDDGRQMWVEDRHIGSSSADTYRYLLKVVDTDANGKEKILHSGSLTGDRSSIRTTNNPVIINH